MVTGCERANENGGQRNGTEASSYEGFTLRPQEQPIGVVQLAPGGSIRLQADFGARKEVSIWLWVKEAWDLRDKYRGSEKSVILRDGESGRFIAGTRYKVGQGLAVADGKGSYEVRNELDDPVTVLVSFTDGPGDK
ncbi:hypothetical protein llg_01500 [Luteolibacter sp. LG18]|nr:hypothetical protein llg_01500 [Luteolibacter sp. LG18]